MEIKNILIKFSWFQKKQKKSAIVKQYTFQDLLNASENMKLIFETYENSKKDFTEKSPLNFRTREEAEMLYDNIQNEISRSMDVFPNTLPDLTEFKMVQFALAHPVREFKANIEGVSHDFPDERGAFRIQGAYCVMMAYSLK